tara:strand:- start:2477 stop:3028 length:552 start_codon:yes stop_codon:yes gene_type:complete
MVVIKFANALRWIINLIHLFASFVALPTLTLVIAADVTMRYFVNRPILGAVEASQFLLLLVFTLGLNFTTLTEKHIRMDLLFDMMPRRMQLGIEILSMFCGIVLFGALARQSFDDYRFSIMISDATEELNIPVWPFQFIMLVVFSLLCVQLVVTTLLKLMPTPENSKTRKSARPKSLEETGVK